MSEAAFEAKQAAEESKLSNDKLTALKHKAQMTKRLRAKNKANQRAH